jgi:hypothetical protein
MFSAAFSVVAGHRAFALARVILRAWRSFMMARWRPHWPSERYASARAADCRPHLVRHEATAAASGSSAGVVVSDGPVVVVDGCVPGVVLRGAAAPGICDGEPEGEGDVNSPLPNHTAVPNTATATRAMTTGT